MPESSRRQIFVTRELPGSALERLGQAHDVSVWPHRSPPTAAELLENVAGCDGLLTLLSDGIDEEVMQAAGAGLKVISNYAVGYNNIDLEAASRRGIRVGNTPDVLTDATADLAVTLLLGAARRVREASQEVSSGDWQTWEPAGLLGRELSGRTLGVIGMGRIGTAMAKRMVGGWNMKLLYTARSDRPKVDESLGGRRVELAELLRQSDFVSIHVALCDETRHLIDEAALAEMKSTAVLVNTARGEIIDQDALVRSLRDGGIFAAGLDVTTPEPLPPSHPLVKSPNALILPHIGSATDTARHEMAEIAVDNVLAGLNGQDLRCEVNLA
ncbi:2-hydroxyacid dehydrogenase [Allorhodopirellula solitaria]|uniref:Glyoxylate/hydroxypyruvate reductase B n=1 Tax=Allorhodopirellula solitaria TaxID=2527987 RepID=A0A5C5YGX3_9BACT|nr:D-glycerate dehydrogenase [Allorhodopirellula solitaria]TWT74233.1 Glyoxylate/hydroxypyruvate reductase B [Allorhodopirellula solitaria]